MLYLLATSKPARGRSGPERDSYELAIRAGTDLSHRNARSGPLVRVVEIRSARTKISGECTRQMQGVGLWETDGMAAYAPKHVASPHPLNRDPAGDTPDPDGE